MSSTENNLLSGAIPTVAVFIAAGVVRLSRGHWQRRAQEAREARMMRDFLLGVPAERIPGFIEEWRKYGEKWILEHPTEK